MKSIKFNLQLLLLSALILVGLAILPAGHAYGATPVQVCAVSYTDESILVLNNGNSKIYYAIEAEASRDKWEVLTVPSDANLDDISVIDISWLSSNVENIIMIKGDANDTQSRIIIKKKPMKLTVSINYTDLDSLGANDGIGSLINIMATEGDGNNPLTFDELQWSKGDSQRWLSTDILTKSLFESYLTKGVNLYFRIAPKDDIAPAKNGTSKLDLSGAVSMFAYTNPFFYIQTDSNGDGILDSISKIDVNNGIFIDEPYPDGTRGRRASSEVKLKITKQTTLPVAGVDGSKFNVNIRYGQEYRVTAETKTTSWIKVTDRQAKPISLSTILSEIGDYDGLTKVFPEMKIEVREFATAKASASKITETKLNPQRTIKGVILEETAPSTPDGNIYITYNGTKNINVTIPSASAENPYEYTVVKQGATFDLSKASWTSISKNTVVKIPSSKAVDFGTFYIRMKEIKYKAKTASSNAIAFQLASTYKIFDIRYPSAPAAAKTTLVFTKGYSNADDVTITVKLNDVSKMPFETKLKSVKLGTRDVPATATVLPEIHDGDLLDPDQVYTMKIVLKVDELAKMPNCTAKALSIYYDNGTVDKTSTKLTIKNPTGASGLTTNLEPGTAVGTTALTVVNPIGADNVLVYQIGATEVTGLNTEDVFSTGIAFASGTEVPVTAGNYLTVYEINNITKKVVKYKSVKVTADKIKQ
jgi:hypothetical protein